MFSLLVLGVVAVFGNGITNNVLNDDAGELLKTNKAEQRVWDEIETASYELEVIE